MNEKCVLDSSAVLALIMWESGSIVVKEIINHSIVSTVNVAEIVAEMNIKLGANPSDAMDAICSLVGEIVPFDLKQATLAGSLKKTTKSLGLSLGDRACIALGVIYNAKIYSADKIWDKIKEPNCQIVIIR